MIEKESCGLMNRPFSASPATTIGHFSAKTVVVFAWRDAFVSSPEKIFKNGAIWCVLENISLKFCKKKL